MGKNFCNVEKKWCKFLKREICLACSENIKIVNRCPRLMKIETIRFADILRQVDFEVVFNKICEFYKSQVKNENGYKKVFNQLLSMTPRKHNLDDLFIEVRMIEDKGQLYPDVSGVNVINPLNQIKYGIEFIDWNDWVSMFITQETLDTIDNVTIVAACLYEMTFYGFEESTIQDTKNSIIDSSKKH